MLRGLNLVIIIILFTDVSFASVVINEIMYNPSGDEYDFEYIELYGKEPNISGWYFEGIDFTFPKNASIDGYLIIANTANETGDNNDFQDRYPNQSARYEYKGTLLNTGETLILRDNEDKIIDLVTYDDWAAENCSLERINTDGYSFDPSNWGESISGGTPGTVNSIAKSTDCDWALKVIMNESATADPSWQIQAVKIAGQSKANLSIKHWIEDSNGDTIKEYNDIIIENALSKSTSSKYTPNLEKGKGYFIEAKIDDISCEDVNSENDEISELFYVLDDKKTITDSSNIQIKDITPGDIKFGDTIIASLNIYRGNTSKYAVYAYVEDDTSKLSEKSTIHVEDKFTNYTIAAPIQIKPNCDEKYKDGEYTLVVEGLDYRTEKEIDLKGINSKNCDKIEVSSADTKGKLTYDIIEMPYTVYLNKEFFVNLNIENDDDDEADLEVWSYVYRGSKKYSIEKENLIYLTIDEEDSAKVALPIKMIEGDEGSYKLKVKIKKKGRVTTYDKTKDIYLKAEKDSSLDTTTTVNTANQQSKALNEKKIEEQIIRRNEIIYESDNFKIKKLIPLFMLILILLSFGFSFAAFKR